MNLSQLPNLGVELLDRALRPLLGVEACTRVERPRRLFDPLLLPRVDLVGVDLVPMLCILKTLSA